jgi:hypothetical protein
MPVLFPTRLDRCSVIVVADGRKWPQENRAYWTRTSNRMAHCFVMAKTHTEREIGTGPSPLFSGGETVKGRSVVDDY